MKKGNFEKNPPAFYGKKLLIAVLSLVLLIAIGTGVSLAYLANASGPVINTFQLGSVGAQIVENLEGNTKNSIQVTNTGESPVYVRLRLVSYWKNGDDIAAKSSALSVSENTAMWKRIGSYYYYTAPLAGGATTDNLLSSGITMSTDDKGYAQVIEVMADTVQAAPNAAVLDVWGIDASEFIG